MAITKSIQMSLIGLAALAVALGRLTVPGHGLSYAGSYEAVAHIVVGALFAVAVLVEESRAFAIASLVAITALETVMFLVQN